uniref:Uncharacterized protein n=1 Tax=Rhizophora mucronata TaxID=61149 RepID=A0A2P2PE90_RHIMU
MKLFDITNNAPSKGIQKQISFQPS